MIKITRLVVVTILITYAANASSQTVCPEFADIEATDDPIEAFDDLLLEGSLGGEGCDSEFCREISEWEQTVASPLKVEQGGLHLNRIRESALMLPSDVPSVRVLQNTLIEWQQRLNQAEVALLPTAIWAPAQFRLFVNRPGEEIDFEEKLIEECPQEVSQCEEMFKTFACVYTHAILQRRVLLQLIDQDRAQTLAYLNRLNLRWEEFNSGGRSLFPWELGANNLIHRKKLLERGFVEPPDYQIALLHPSLALEYQDSAEGDLEEALVLELVGFYRWNWGGENNATIRRPFGASVVTSWTGDNDLGYGVMFHLPRNLSLAVTRREIKGDEETAFLLSVDLGKLLTDGGKMRRNLIEKIGERAGGN